MRTSKRWPAQEIETLKRCADQGMTAFETAAHLPERTQGAVETKAGCLKISFHSGKNLGRMNWEQEREIEASLPRVPPRSTESLTAFVLGDPAPGRSALDQRAGR